jgi:cholesterol transport system auxiliary component
MTRHATRVLLSCLPIAMLAGCGGVFESSLAAPQAYVLRLPPPAVAGGQAAMGSVLVRRPEAGPGLNTDRIALLRSEGRFDVYAAARWAAPAPDLLESVLVDALRGTGQFSAVLDDSAAFAPRYDLRVALRRFEADYTAGGAPMVQVVMDCTLGRHRDRHLLASFTARGSARAEGDRLGAVVAAFEAATAGAVAELLRATTAAIAAESSAAGPPGASEGR